MPGPLCGNNVGPTIAFGSAATLDQAKFFTREIHGINCLFNTPPVIYMYYISKEEIVRLVADPTIALTLDYPTASLSVFQLKI
jgi:hypothetical protein